MTRSRQESNHLASSSSSSTSPTTTVLSDSEAGAREDLSGIDSFPVSVTSDHDERGDTVTKPTRKSETNNEDLDLERGDPLCSDILEWLLEFRENLVDDSS